MIIVSASHHFWLIAIHGPSIAIMQFHGSAYIEVGNVPVVYIEVYLL